MSRKHKSKGKGILIHGKRYEAVHHYIEEKLIAIEEAISDTEFLKVVDITNMPYFHQDYGCISDNLTHLIIEKSDEMKDPKYGWESPYPMITSDVIYSLDEIKYVRWHSFEVNPKNPRQILMHFTID